LRVRNEAVSAYDAEVTFPLTLLPKIYDAVCAVVMNAEALTHDAELAVNDCVAFIDCVAYNACVDEATVPFILDANTYEAVSAVVIFADADTHDADVDVNGTNDIALAVAAIVANDEEIDSNAHDAVIG